MSAIQPVTGSTTSRRLKRVIVNWELLRDLFSEGSHPDFTYSVIGDPVPVDAVLVNIRYAWPNCAEFLICSEQFGDVKDGEEIPLITPTCRRSQ